jgi:hypothetical protein
MMSSRFSGPGRRPADAASITCPRCHRTSWNPNDIREGYCGFCHAFTRGDLAVEPPTCPRCGEVAALLMPPEQAFCGNEACNVLMWNPRDPESWTREHVVHLDAERES